MPEVELVTDVESLDALVPEWDALAAVNGLPQLSPAWVLAWWHHIAPHGATPRTVVVRDGGQLIGLAPFYCEPTGGGRRDFRLPGIEIAARLAPLALHGREWDVAATLGGALCATAPRPDALRFEGIPIEGQWLTALRDGWPGPLRPPQRLMNLDGNPLMSMREPSFEDWLAGRSANFRQQMRRLRRRFADAGGVSRVASRATLADDAAALMRLHALRWGGRGHSNLVDLGERFSAFVSELGEGLLDEQRFALRILELDGEPICAQLFVRAGGTTLFVNGGWDERHAALKPSMLCLLDAVEEAFALGVERFDLGVGVQSYKLRFADGSAQLAWGVLLSPGARFPLTAARTAPALAQARLRDGARRLLPERQAERLRSMRQRLRGAQ
jgi:CelD/BcsL family acetyltransferase involved in cellulose biosynthesis